MLNIAIQLISINAEKLSQAIPPQLNFSVNLTLPSSEPIKKSKQFIIPFTFSISSNPPIVQIVLKGNVMVTSDSDSEFKKLSEDIEARRIPVPVVQAVFINSIAESILLSRALGLPPPIPSLPQLIDMSREVKKDFKQETVI
ncbi:MAG: hypothetical protein QXX35_00980 [Desulfurococcaceae archaeon]|uniref:Uncharacterized protein n=1 Tax=Staphylothermus marinus TaxID=2280 RepID=A0A7C4HB15_STAMA